MLIHIANCGIEEAARDFKMKFWLESCVLFRKAMAPDHYGKKRQTEQNSTFPFS